MPLCNNTSYVCPAGGGSSETPAAEERAGQAAAAAAATEPAENDRTIVFKLYELLQAADMQVRQGQCNQPLVTPSAC